MLFRLAAPQHLKKPFFGGGNTQRTKGTNKDIKNIFLAFGGLIFLKSVMIKTSKNLDLIFCFYKAVKIEAI